MTKISPVYHHSETKSTTPSHIQSCPLLINEDTLQNKYKVERLGWVLGLLDPLVFGTVSGEYIALGDSCKLFLHKNIMMRDF